MMYVGLGVILLIFGLYLTKFRERTFEYEEAKRYLFKFNKVDDNWSSRGRVYTQGLALIENKKTGKKEFIKQAELCDIRILV